MDTKNYISRYTPNTSQQKNEMLKDIKGVNSLNDLFADLPSNLVNPQLNLPGPLSELELKNELTYISKLNHTPGEFSSFLGAGSYRHFIPSIVRQITSRSEFMTSYTPYQPEISQGTLQAHYEFQSMICQLTNMEIANSGMYDGATSMAEAALMAVRITKKKRIAVLNTVSPFYIEVLKTFLEAPEIEIDIIHNSNSLSPDTACIILQQPSFLGNLEDIEQFSNLAKKNASLLVVSVDPISLGMIKPPGDYEADIVVGEGQALGIAPTFGGPYVGIFATKEKFIRQMPGRIVGQTVDTNGNPGYVLTMQTREQHIRRDKATSNICTSVGLIALGATVYLAALGKSGLAQISNLCYEKAHYAANLIDSIPGYQVIDNGLFFREFVVKCPISPKKINTLLIENKIIGGLDLSDQIENGMLLCFTEMNSKKEIDHLVDNLKNIQAK